MGVTDGAFGAGSVDPAGDASGPAGYDIKGNADSMLYHTIESPYFGRAKAAVWFDSEASADAAGFTRWDRRERNAGGDGGGAEARDGTDVQGSAAVSVPEGAYGPGSADPNPDGSGPAGYDIKGNADSMLYHTPESEFYSVTKAEVVFNTEEAARAAGFRNFKD